MKKVLQAALVVLATSLGFMGCKCVCPQNKKAGIPTIVCQPMAQYVYSNQDASFTVTAKGKNLSYQWFFQDTNGISPVLGGTSPTLVVAASNPIRYGLYSCMIESAGPFGQAENQTGWFPLNLAQLADTSTNGVTTVTVYNVPGGVNPCCANCGWANAQNNGLGYGLCSGQTLTFSVKDSAGNVLDASNYCAIWRYGSGTNQFGCCTVVDSTHYQFKDVVGTTCPTKTKYAFTVYFKTLCAASGAQDFASWQVTP